MDISIMIRLERIPHLDTMILGVIMSWLEAMPPIDTLIVVILNDELLEANFTIL